MSFIINYKGTSCRGTTFLYFCKACSHEQEEQHPAADAPKILCAECSCVMVKKPTVTSLDAEHHDSMLSRNLGWDENA